MRDPAFPALHGRPDRGWVNDPHGLCRVDDRWHVFQHNPEAPVHEAIAWGHAGSSTWSPGPPSRRPSVPGSGDRTPSGAGRAA